MPHHLACFCAAAVVMGRKFTCPQMSFKQCNLNCGLETIQSGQNVWERTLHKTLAVIIGSDHMVDQLDL